MIKTAGDVFHIVLPDRYTVINVTIEGHMFYPGTMERSVVLRNDRIYIRSHGHGIGPKAWFNELIGPVAMSALDGNIRAKMRTIIEQTMSEKYR